MRAANAGEALAIVLVDEFVRCGMTDACLAPGSRSTPMALALAKNPRIKLHVSIDERSAGFLALGIAKESRRAVALLTTSGTATANLLPAIIEAHLSAVPLIVLTADRPPELRGTGAGQTIDQIKLYADYVGWFSEVGVPESREGSVEYWRSVACRAWGQAREAVSGPVHLNLSFRDPLVPVADEAGFPFALEGRPDRRPWHEFKAPRVETGAAEMASLVQEVRAAERGLIVVGFADWGDGGNREHPGHPDGSPAHPAVRLADQLGWPLLAEATSGARTGYPAVSAYDALLRHRPFADSHRPDLVIRIGSIGLSSALNRFLDSSIRQITVHNGPFVPDPRRASSLIVRSDPVSFCETLCSRAGKVATPDWLESWMEADAAARREIDRVLRGFPEWTEPGLARGLAACLPNGSSLVAASSMPIRDLDWFMQPREHLRLFSNRGANGIDGFVSSVVGIALSSPGYTAALCGDLSLLHDQNGLLFARNNDVDAAFVVANNNGGGIFSFLPQAAGESHFEDLFGTPHNIDLGPLMRAYGLEYTLLENQAALAPAIERARTQGGIHVLEARTDRRRNVEVHNDLWQAVSGVL